MQDLILVGIQGSGKGTQAKILAEKFGFQIFETGGALRKMAQEESVLGKKVKEITERGDLVPNEIVMEIVDHFVKSLKPGTPAIFDGIPRSDEQRQSLEKLLQNNKRDFTALEIRLSKDTAFKRLLRRAEIENRADDNQQVIEKRIENFFRYTEPLLEIWRKNGKLVSIDGEPSVEEVTRQVFSGLKLPQ